MMVSVSSIRIEPGVPPFKPGIKKLVLWAALTAGILAIIAAAISSNYQPSIHAREGFGMVVATQPATIFERMQKQWQMISDVRPCTYELFGWASDERFYYQSTCGEAITIWSIDPSREARASKAATAPDDLTGESITFSTAFEYMTFPGFDPETHDAYHFLSFLETNQLRQSVDGKWIAVVSEHWYGPQDVILVRVED